MQAGAGGEGHLRMNVEPVAEMTGYFSPTWRVLPGYMPSTPSVPISKAWPGHEHMRRTRDALDSRMALFSIWLSRRHTHPLPFPSISAAARAS